MGSAYQVGCVWQFLVEFLEFIIKKIKKGKGVDVVHLGFNKAFDKVPRKRLVQLETR